MQEQRQHYRPSASQRDPARQRSALRQRTSAREERTPSVLFTALSAGAVLLLLAVTFAADWFRTPEVNITGAPQFLSPNQDNSYDNATINYRVSEEAEISARVLNEAGAVVRTLAAGERVTAGQRFLVWNGADDRGWPVTDGNYRVEITAKGTLRSRSASVPLLVDTTPPGLQLLNLPDGLRVREDVLTVEGVTEPNATIWINGSFQPVAVDGAGRFRAEQRLGAGPNPIEVRAVDAAGNSTTLSRTVALVNEAPQVVVHRPAEGAWINSPMVTIEGSAPPGVTLKINNQAVPVSGNGSFRYDLLLDEGDQRIQLLAVDDVGNQTSLDRFVRVKTRGPKLELSVADGSVFSDPLLQLSGATTPGTLVMVNQRPVTVGALGDFQTTLNLAEGDNFIQVQARDQAGNLTELSRRVVFEIPGEAGGVNRLWRNVNALPTASIPAILLLALVLGYFLYRQNQLDIELTVDNNVFTPGLPQEGRVLTLRLDLNQAANVTLEVLDAAGQVQATLLDHRRRTARQHIFLWDGYDDYGQPVLAGNYIIKATAGAPPIKVSSAVQVRIEADAYVTYQAEQHEQVQQQGNLTAQYAARRRLRQNRKRI